MGIVQDQGFVFTANPLRYHPHTLRLNSYRVLLTRGRDGFIIFVPPDPFLDSTYQVLLQAGVRDLIHMPVITPGMAVESMGV